VKLPRGHLITDWPRDDWFVTVSGIPFRESDLKALGPRVHLMKADGSKVRTLGDPGCVPGEARLAPDGRRVLFVGCDPKAKPFAHFALFVMDLEGGKPRRLSPEGGGEEVLGACWSPDGKRVAYVARQRHADLRPDEFVRPTQSSLVVVSADGKDPVTLVAESSSQAHAVLLASPDWR